MCVCCACVCAAYDAYVQEVFCISQEINVHFTSNTVGLEELKKSCNFESSHFTFKAMTKLKKALIKVRDAVTGKRLKEAESGAAKQNRKIQEKTAESSSDTNINSD